MFVLHGVRGVRQAAARAGRRHLWAILSGPLVLLLVILLSACGPAHAAQYPQTTLSPRGELAWMIQDLFSIILIMAALVFVVVEGLLVYAVFRFRQRPGQGLPPQIHGNSRLEIAWTIAPAVVLAIIAIPTVRTIFAAADVSDPNALQVRVIGHQWWWEFQLPEQKIVTANELYIPVGQRVVFKLESADVIHSFWVPALGGTRDMVPGHVNEIWYKADEPGEFLGQCKEYCGLSHANMRFRVIAVPRDQWEAWVKQMQAPAAKPAPGSIEAKGEQIFMTKPCVGCHTIDGTAAKATVGPNLTHVGSRTTLAGGMMPNNAADLAKWLKDPPAVKPGSKMPNVNLTDDEINALVPYLLSLK